MTVTPVEAGSPVVIALPAAPFMPCDAHAESNTQALFEVALASGGVIHLCGHHAYKHFGITDKTWLHEENRQKGQAS